jgi:glycosyltransferase involved in cell wall biosynthesis
LLWPLGVGSMLTNAAAIHYTSAQEQQAVERSLGLRDGWIVPLGVDDPPHTPSNAPGEFRIHFGSLGVRPYVLALGRLHPVKGLEILLDSFLEVVQDPRLREWQLVVAGGGDQRYASSLARRVSEQNGKARVLFAGWLDGDLKVAALRGAALLAQPSYHENFGLSVAEALLCGVPVLVSEHVALADLIRKTHVGWVCSLDRAALVSALRDILLDGSERAIRGAAAREMAVSEFTWPSLARRLMALYSSVERGAVG